MEAKSNPKQRDSLNPEATRPHKILNGWKEIADYVGRGVRTVQRWEALGLPIRRPNARLRSAVVTTAGEIDAWLEHCGDGRSVGNNLAGGPYDRLEQEVVALRLEVEKLRGEAQSLREQLDPIRSAATQGRSSGARISREAA